MKQTLLGLTQSILSDLNSDEVNSIGDTTESLQVAEIIRQAYFNILTRAGLGNLNQLFQLSPSTDASLPILMYKPDNVTKIDWVKYYYLINISDSAPTFEYVELVPIEQFLKTVNRFNPDETQVGSYTFNNFTLFYKNNAQPRCCAQIQNKYILFDSYDSEIDSTLQGSKTLCYGQIIPSFSMDDNFIPELDDIQFPLLLNEAKALAFMELKQMPHPKAEQEVKRQWNTLQKNKNLIDTPSDFNQLPSFGRKRTYY